MTQEHPITPPSELVQQLLGLPPGEAEAILRRHALRIPKETVKRLRQEQADMIYAAQHHFYAQTN